MLATTLLVVALAGAHADPLSDCEPAPGTPLELARVTRCIYSAARATGEADRAIARVEQLAAEHPDAGWPRGTLASLYNMTDPTLAGPAYQQAAALFEAAGEDRGLTLALLNLNTWHGRRGEIDEGRAALARAVEAAESTGDARLHASVLSQQARWAANYEGDYFLAYELAYETLDAAADLDDASGYTPRLFAGATLTHVLGQFGLVAELEETREWLIALAEGQGDRLSLANLLFDEAYDDVESWRASDRDPATRDALIDQLIDVVELADDAPNPPIAALARCSLGSLLDGPEGAALVEQGLSDIRALDYPEDEAECLIRMANRLDASRAPEVETVAMQAAAAAARAEEPDLAIRAHLLATQAAWEQDPVRARTLGESTLTRVEGYADRQRDSLTRARLFADHANASYLHAARLRETAPAGPQGAASRAEAFGTMERMRGRELVLQLERAEALHDASPDPEADLAYQRVLGRLTAHQAALVSGETGATEAALDDLTRLELEASGLRADLLRSVPRTSRLLASPDLLAEVAAALAPGEVLVTTQLPQASGDLFAPIASWAFVVTRDAVHEVPLPSRSALDERVDLYLGLLEARDPLAERAGALLYADLVEPVLAVAPSEVARLVLVLDGPLQRLPLAALAAEGEAPLGTRIELARTPSAQVWLRWRTAEAGEATEVLALADPEHPGIAGESSFIRAFAWEELDTLGPLPHAGEEAEDLARRLGAEVWTGAAASEVRLKDRDLTHTGLLHLAAHAVVDARYPDRSAVLLSPGSEGEDGLLQPREIADLRLPGTLVVLSACQSATGALVDGEGVVGLARAFVVAGASGVVGSLWPVRDDEARAFFQAFYAHLSTGARPGAALRDARRDRHEAGAPPHAWAGMVLIGDPAHQVWVSRSAPRTSRLLLAGLLGALMLAGLARIVRRRRLG